ncbi:MAG TPA: EAL domain-containing protein [Usitatibacter sp.]|nr:EAL domain-containing protein [Usitatibacter sp.]
MAHGSDNGYSAFSLASAAEEILRASPGASVEWQGASLTTHFQPLFSVRRQRCSGFEALVRAVDDEGALAWERLHERTDKVARVLLDWTCRAMHLRNYARVDPGDLTLSINIHPEAAVRDAGRAKEFDGLIRYYGLAPKRLCVEILPAACSSEEKLRDAVDGYRALGVAIAVGEFGTGCSNFDRVMALRPELVKIDRALLAGTVGNERARRMLPGMVALLHEARTKVAVEGIETRSEALLAVESRADFVQGYFFGNPQAALDPDGGAAQELGALLDAARLAAA